eukprot:CAMPEP_0185584666 /NCGR_PEP_ID=MMETSP0434-20130131/33592_1 /TAXON_ID=626734 ORGANISM="Favella taraikaensis, Strain Fe Narragansett Bay" /NCGR_SAMPLE_ID=MMETSP0434 /ASSEMBLY_ACC=CAM_ASM_000379 /LENGTH=97 /DNA_ID=CAMNT_0028204557 /DNA_START=95 /DNA_END=389 /DNA_ORIENTATION=+
MIWFDTRLRLDRALRQRQLGQWEGSELKRQGRWQAVPGLSAWAPAGHAGSPALCTALIEGIENRDRGQFHDENQQVQHIEIGDDNLAEDREQQPRVE